MSIIRNATSDDIDRCAELLGILFSQEHEFAADRANQSKGLGMVIGNPEMGRVFVCEVDGSIQGMVMLLFTVSTYLGEKVALLEDMIVAPAYRGKGYGSRLIDHAIDFARSSGIRRITLLTDHDNETGQQFYLSRGFLRSGMAVFRKLLC
ncbi:MAG: GNAT family N-acetyltransferase [Chlorobiaceae bacterium]|jgi:GNAT superfamily N-acetyltransferase|nr:GNAT family N-acetyltransferase [Chlorobiaceae bacterium]